MTKEISNSDDIIDSRDVISRIEELEASRKPWAAGWNMPGYMPDSEPAQFETFDDARDYISEEMRRAADGISSEGDEEAAELEGAAARWEAIETEGEQGETVGNYHYWIARLDGKDAFEDEAEFDEYTALNALAYEAEGCADWQHGETLIRESYFKTYAQELADDIGAIPRDVAWPMTCIDWEQAARELKYDYTTVTFDGVDYLIRS